MAISTKAALKRWLRSLLDPPRGDPRDIDRALVKAGASWLDAMAPYRNPLGHIDLPHPAKMLGEKQLENCRLLSNREAILRKMKTGGIAAEARFTGDYAWDAAGKDFQYVRQLTVQRAGERRAERLERRMLSKVEHLLAQEGHWRAVELIAAELMRLGEISGRAARHLFERGCAEC